MNIDKFIERRNLEEVLDLEIKPLDNYIEYLKLQGINYTDYDTNGFQCDFRLSFDNGLIIAGSLWYGNYILFWSEIDENEEE
jgi:hypothetical protein